MRAEIKTLTTDFFQRLSFWRLVLIVILSLAAYATVIRFAKGLGASTNLTDAFPWGLWIGFDVLVGVGLAAGGFVIAATVHVFRMERYEPIARATVLTAFLGYLLVVVALMFDLGRPYRIWHPLVMWNPHSVMFEVGWCVMLYSTVLALEFSPLVFERLGLERPKRFVSAIFVPLVIIGVLLSTMHQSSLGTLYVIAPDKLHGLWYTPLLPVFFVISAIAAGLSMTIFESFMSRRAFGKKLEFPLLEGLARASVVILAVYAVWKFLDLGSRGNLALATTVTPESVLFWGEMALGTILPMVLFATPRVRRNENGLVFAATLTILGFIVNRLNVAITGMAASSGTLYIPSWMELAVTTAVVAVGFVAFGLAVQHLNIFPAEDASESAGATARKLPTTRPLPSAKTTPLLTKEALAAIWVLFLVGAVLAGTTLKSRTAAASDVPEEAEHIVQQVPRADLQLPPVHSFPTSSDSPGPVLFDHESHVDTASPQCSVCHQALFSLLEPGTNRAGEWNYESIHEGDYCGSCHDGIKAFSATEDCDFCHQDSN